MVGVNKLNGEVFYSTCQGSGIVARIIAPGQQETIASSLSFPAGLAFDKTGNLFVTGHGDQVIYKFAKDTWAKSIVAGTAGTPGYANGPALQAKFASLGVLRWMAKIISW